MELPTDANRLPKLPFLIGDLAFFAIAAFLAYRAGEQPSTASIVGIIVCTGVGVALGIAPFIAAYASRQDQQLTERQGTLESLVRTTSSAVDQASITANGLHEIAEVTKRNLHEIDTLPARIKAARRAAQSQEDADSTPEFENLRLEIQQWRDAHSAQLASKDHSIDRLLTGVTRLEETLSSQISQLTNRVDKLAAQPRPAPHGDSPTPAPAPAKKPKAKLLTKSPKIAKPVLPPEPTLFDASTSSPQAISDVAVDTDPAPMIENRSTEIAAAPDASPTESNVTATVAEEPETSAPEDSASLATFSAATESHLEEPAPPESSPSPDGITRLTVIAYTLASATGCSSAETAPS
ncbi:MAG: hypothetical protein J6386_07830 [Candidatus Synoicihabitans palmerolidicus]|nr:hypothetical protein [Candidatus Synoicihabitans palmerolidicus]